MGRILGADGKAFAADGNLPKIHRAPPIQIPGRFKKKKDFESAITFHKLGFFQLSSWVVEQMMSAAPVASAMQTRCDKLTGRTIQFAPGKQNDKGRRAARDCEEEDFALMCAATARAQLHSWGLMQGAAFAQKHWYISPTSGRAIPKVELFHPMWTQWDWSLWAYRCWTWTTPGETAGMGGWRIVPSPALTVPGEPWRSSSGTPLYPQDDPRLWIVAEPFGAHSWRDCFAFVISLWESYFGWALANNDMNRVCEKQGRGQSILEYPAGTDKDARDKLIANILNANAEAVFPLEQYGLDVEKETSGYKLKPFEWSAQGWNIVSGTKESNASDIGGRILGHNTQASTKGATGAGGGARIGAEVRGDIGVADCAREFAWLYEQVLRDWAAVNYGDPDCAPIPVYAIDDPMANVAAAQTSQFLAAAFDVLHRYGIDTTELARRFQMPIRDEALAPDWKPEPAPVKASIAAPETPAKEERGEAAP